MYFAYGPTKVEKEVHGTAINYVIVCMFMLQINLLAFTAVFNVSFSIVFVCFLELQYLM